MDREQARDVNYPALLAAVLCVVVPAVAVGEYIRWQFMAMDVMSMNTPAWVRLITAFGVLEQSIGFALFFHAWLFRRPSRRGATTLGPYLWASFKALFLLYAAFHFAFAANAFRSGSLNGTGVLLGPLVYVVYPFISLAWSHALFANTASTDAWANTYILIMLAIMTAFVIGPFLIGALYHRFMRQPWFAVPVFQARHFKAATLAASLAALFSAASWMVTLWSVHFHVWTRIVDAVVQLPLFAAHAFCGITLVVYAVERIYVARAAPPDAIAWTVGMAIGLPMISLVENVLAALIGFVLDPAMLHFGIGAFGLSRLPIYAATSAVVGYLYARQLGVPPIKWAGAAP